MSEPGRNRRECILTRNSPFVGFFNVPVQAPTRDHPFHTVFRETAHLVAFTTRWGYGGHIFDLTPGSHGGPNAIEDLSNKLDLNRLR